MRNIDARNPDAITLFAPEIVGNKLTMNRNDEMKDPKPTNLEDDAYFKGFGWRAISRDVDGHVVSAIMPLFDDCYQEWVMEQSEFGYTVVDLQ